MVFFPQTVSLNSLNLSSLERCCINKWTYWTKLSTKEVEIRAVLMLVWTWDTGRDGSTKMDDRVMDDKNGGQINESIKMETDEGCGWDGRTEIEADRGMEGWREECFREQLWVLLRNSSTANGAFNWRYSWTIHGPANTSSTALSLSLSSWSNSLSVFLIHSSLSLSLSLSVLQLSPVTFKL